MRLLAGVDRPPWEELLRTLRVGQRHEGARPGDRGQEIWWSHACTCGAELGGYGDAKSRTVLREHWQAGHMDVAVYREEEPVRCNYYASVRCVLHLGHVGDHSEDPEVTAPLDEVDRELREIGSELEEMIKMESALSSMQWVDFNRRMAQRLRVALDGRKGRTGR